MKLTIPFDQLTTAEKLQAMEDLWSNLTEMPDKIASPGWHRDVLEARRARVEQGESQFADWNKVRQSLQADHWIADFTQT